MKALITHIQQLGIPGGQISFVKPDGYTVDCAFGWGGSGGVLSTVSEQNIFRYASLAKILTSITAIKLAQQHTIALNWHLLPSLGLKTQPSDARITDITLSQLLRHRAGFDRSISGDPMLKDQPWCPAHLTTLSLLKLDFTPEEKYSYSNLGYCLLGQALVQTTGKPLTKLITDTLDLSQYSSIQPIVSSAGLTDEVSYFFDSPDTEQQQLRFNYPAMLASGGWAGTAAELSKLMQQQLSAENSTELLLDAGIYSECDLTVWRNCHGMVFYKYQQPQQHVMYWRDGSLPGLSAFVAATKQADTVVLLLNYRKYQWLKFNDAIGMQIYRYLNN
ncbi:MAG: beta-lactamase family protein [Gammaproteobacteria bacterium]|nr:beta-lactamase family protein [Gammaproteobacteria bacterium]MBU1553568.1 beta-lactamase family protein [Gammaproteobacteria bacterium]MBU2072470.1 beta-lactamase family protein [Gammaproteobacteria bacterium]MBU2181395.1 beta-lactamase family protein [Gammaproteobacteria bacterium]MBU2204267.1 beta-lactamase family protein [Gammaproteobacteria bacterium]